MRTTIRLDDGLLERARRAALERGSTLTAVIEDALRRALAREPAERVGAPDLPVFHGDGLLPGIDLEDTSALLDAMDASDARP